MYICRIYNKISTKTPRCLLHTDSFVRLATRKKSRPLSGHIMKSVPHDVPVFITKFRHGGQERKYEVHLKSYQHVTISGVLWKFVQTLILHLPAKFAVIIAAFPSTKAFWHIMPVSTGKGSPTFRRMLLTFSSVYSLTQRKRPEDSNVLTSNSTHFIIFYEMCRNSLPIQLCTCGSTAVSVPVFIKWDFKHKCWFRYYRT